MTWDIFKEKNSNENKIKRKKLNKECETKEENGVRYVQSTQLLNEARE